MLTLHQAAKAGDIKALEYWIHEKKADINQEKGWMTPFLWAAKYADAETLKWLVDNGADFKKSVFCRYSAFYVIVFLHAGNAEHRRAKVDYLFSLTSVRFI